MLEQEKLLKDKYKVNKKEYLRLMREEHGSAYDFEEWKIFYKYVGINKKLNNLFKRDPFISKLLFSSDYKNLIIGKNEYGYIGELNPFSFDHSSSIKVCPDVSKIRYADTIRGTITFPYFHNWEEIKAWIDKVPEDNYSVYIINPILLFYGLVTVGLFLTPKFYNGMAIELCNHYIIGLTGYPLFLTFSMDDEVEKIKYVDLKLSKENFIKEMYELSDKNKTLFKALNFWKDNDDFSIPSIESEYELYMDVQAYRSYDEINFIKMISKKPFMLVHEDTNQILGPFKEFELDKAFKVIDTDKGEIELSDEELDDILKGKYDFTF